MNNFFDQDDGMVLAFVAMVLPVVLLIGALMIDGGLLYIRHGEIEHLSRQSGQSGLLALSQALETEASNNYQDLCDVEFPPSLCDSTNLFDFLTETEINDLVLNGVSQSTVTSNTLNFGTTYDPRTTLAADDMAVTFPYLFTPGDNQARILVEISTTPALLLGQFFPTEKNISYSAISYLPLQ